MQQKPGEQWPENIHHLLDAVEKVAGYTSKKEILQTTSITMVYLLNADAAVISVWDAESQLIVPEAYHTSGDWQVPSSWYKPKTVADHPLFQRVESLGHSAQFNLGGLSLPVKMLKFMEEAGIQSWIAIPLIGSDQSILGVVDVMVTGKSRVFSDVEVSAGTLLAKLSSVAYQRAVLLDLNGKKEKNLNSIAEWLSMHSESEHDGTHSDDIDNLAKAFVNSTQADNVVISKFDSMFGNLVQLSTDRKFSDNAGNHGLEVRLLDDCPPAAAAVEERKSVFFNMADPAHAPAIKQYLQDNKIGSLLVLPLMSDEKVYGLVEISNKDPEHVYSKDELWMVKILVRHTMRAINLSETYVKRERERRSSEALVKAARKLNSTLNIDEVLEHILEQLILVLECKSANIQLVEKNLSRLVKSTGYEDTPGALNIDVYPLTIANLKYMYESRTSILLEYTDDIPDWIVYEGNEWIKSYLGAPMLVGDEVIGFLNMDSDIPGFFSKDMIPAVEAFASLAASVLHNAQQYKLIQDRAAELEIVRRATLSLTSSLDLEEVLSSILKQSLSLLSGQCDGHIFLYRNNLLSFGAAMQGDGTQGVIWSEPREDGLTYTVARTGNPIIVDDMQKHPLYRHTPDNWVGSIIGFPLKYGDSVVGVMNIAHQETYRFQDQEIRILSLLADQAAISIVNANLHNIVQEQSLTDPLTNLNNRRAFSKRLEEETLRSERYGRPFSLALMDLNGFKSINDTFGHMVGDQVLIRIGECLKENVRNTDFLARYGGDEFALIMPETSKQIAIQMTNRLQRILQNCEYRLPDLPMMPISVSIGIAQFPDHARTVDPLIAAADDALYQAKRIWIKKNN